MGTLTKPQQNRRSFLTLSLGLTSQCSVSFSSVNPAAVSRFLHSSTAEIQIKQECIQVGCVPPAAVVVRGGGGLVLIPWISHLDVGLDLIPLNFPLGCGPGSDPPQFPPWVWAWIWSPLNFPLGCGPGSDPPQFPPWVWAWIWSPSISPLGVGLEGESPWQGVLPGRGCIAACTEADPLC